jgi:hypothetical protein
MLEKAAQGVVSVTGTDVLIAPSNASAKLVTFTVYNPASHTFTVTKYEKRTNTTTVLYSFNLAAGDTFIDSRTYYLSALDRINFTSSVAGTTYELLYMIYGTN